NRGMAKNMFRRDKSRNKQERYHAEIGCSKRTKGVLCQYASPSLLNREFANQEALNIDLNI
ncbi:hypothetical protein AB4491_11425, partial [Vibrio sp. 10N.261.45.A7]